MDIFRALSLPELDDAIKSLALQLASGASQIASPDAGSASYVSRSDALKTLKALERSRSKRLGLPVAQEDRVRFTKVILQKDYHQR